ncbi:glycoside hydrolase family 97 catalytic domain-containing protein [Planctomycetota bacterium]|nr:glycoside hydrolase family 97 catalytic domain-containing protein [Planctomycetota bacterium]
MPTYISKLLIHLSLFFAIFAYVSRIEASIHTLTSPDRKLVATFSNTQSKSANILYNLTFAGKQVINSSSIKLFDESCDLNQLSKTLDVSNTWKPVYGHKSTFIDHYNELVLQINYSSGKNIIFTARMYNEGLAFRFHITNTKQFLGETLRLKTTYNFPEDFSVYYPNGEFQPEGPIKISSYDKHGSTIRMPMVVDAGKNTFLCLLESDLYKSSTQSNCEPMNIFKGDVLFGLESDSAFSNISSRQFQTPWRIILTANSPGDFLTSDIPLNLATPCQIADTSWISPGISTWELRTRGAIFNNFQYENNQETMLRMVDFASSNNFEYLLIDGMWFRVKNGQMQVRDEKYDMNKIISYAKENDVKLLLYYDEHYADPNRKNYRGEKVLPIKSVFEFISDLGAAGIKFGFKGYNVNFTRDAIKLAAKYKLLINFHDYPVPMIGVRRTYPNAITREYCHAQADRHTTFSPNSFIRQAQINLIAGPMDQCNGYFSFSSLKSRWLGFENGVVESTIVSEAARILITSWGGLQTIPDAPEAYLSKPDLFQFIKKLPNTWDDSRCIDIKLNEYIFMARKYKNTWYVAGAANNKGGKVQLKMNFLTSSEYSATIYEDADDAHYQDNPSSYVKRTSLVKPNETLDINMAPGGGFCMILKPLIN